MKAASRSPSYDSRLSLYGLVPEHGLPAGAVLVEHLPLRARNHRLVQPPPSYNGTIRPLRDASSSSLKPAVVPWRTRGTAGDNSVNEEEAQAVIRLLRAMIHDPAYDGESLRHHPDAKRARRAGENRIRRLLVENFDPRDRAPPQSTAFRAEFQGDERDVVILSLVDSAAPGFPSGRRPTAPTA